MNTGDRKISLKPHHYIVTLNIESDLPEEELYEKLCCGYSWPNTEKVHAIDIQNTTRVHHFYRTTYRNMVRAELKAMEMHITALAEQLASEKKYLNKQLWFRKK